MHVPEELELPWWMPTVELPSGRAVPVLSAEGMDFVIWDQIAGRFFPSLLADAWLEEFFPEWDEQPLVVA